MKLRKFIFLLLIALFSLTFAGCGSSGCSDSSPDDDKQDEADIGDYSSGFSDSDYTEGEDGKLTWSAGYDSTVRIVSNGTGSTPDTQTIKFAFAYDTVSLKKSGYTTLTFELAFNVYIDNDISTSSDVDIYFKNGNNAQIGVGWSGQHFTNVSRKPFTYSKSIDIANFQQKKGNLYLTFDAVKNTFLTNTYISNIELTITAEK